MFFYTGLVPFFWGNFWYLVPALLLLVVARGYFFLQPLVFGRASRASLLGLTKKQLGYLALLFLALVFANVYFIHASHAVPPSPHARYVFRISDWAGRTGNNFIQIKSAARYAICCRGILRIPSHDVFTGMKAEYDFALVPIRFNNNFRCANLSGQFMEEPRLPYACNRDEDMYLRHVIFGTEMLAAGAKERPPQKLEFELKSERFSCPDNEDSLAIHFRSGDLFSHTQHHHFYYRQPPRSFYKRVLGLKKWSKVYFITDAAVEDYIHPNYKYFRDAARSNPSHVFSNTNFIDDFKAMFCARSFVMASSSMSWLVVDLSPFVADYFSPFLPYCTSIDFQPLAGGSPCWKEWAHWMRLALEPAAPSGPSPYSRNITYFQFPGFDVEPKRHPFTHGLSQWGRVDDQWKQEWNVRITSESVDVKGPMYYTCPPFYKDW